MARHGARALGVEAPEAVVASLAQEPDAVGAQVTLEISTLHPPMTSSSGSLSAPAATVAFSPKRNSRIPRSASMTFARASSRVRPWLFAPGTSGIEAMIHPSWPYSYTIVIRSDSLSGKKVADRADDLTLAPSRFSIQHGCICVSLAIAVSNCCTRGHLAGVLSRAEMGRRSRWRYG